MNLKEQLILKVGSDANKGSSRDLRDTKSQSYLKPDSSICRGSSQAYRGRKCKGVID